MVAFDIGGLPDIVMHHKTGYLAKAFDTEDFAIGVLWVLGQLGKVATSTQVRQKIEVRNIHKKLGLSAEKYTGQPVTRQVNKASEGIRDAARSRAIQQFSSPIISASYKKVYEKLICNT